MDIITGMYIYSCRKLEIIQCCVNTPLIDKLSYAAKTQAVFIKQIIPLNTLWLQLQQLAIQMPVVLRHRGD